MLAVVLLIKKKKFLPLDFLLSKTPGGLLFTPGTVRATAVLLSPG